MNEVLIPIANDHVRSAGKARVHGVLAEHDTERRVVRVRRQAANHVAGIDVL